MRWIKNLAILSLLMPLLALL